MNDRNLSHKFLLKSLRFPTCEMRMRLPIAEAKWGGLVEGGAWRLSINGLLLLMAAAGGGSFCIERRAWNLEVRMLTLTNSYTKCL